MVRQLRPSRRWQLESESRPVLAGAYSVPLSSIPPVIPYVPMITVGIDLAAQAENTAACSILWRADVAEVQQITCNLNDADLLELVKTGNKVGIDVPLGWPSAFVQAVSNHQLFLPWPTNTTRELRYRKTDLFVIDKTGYHPLSVSTDRIGVASMRVASLMTRMEGPIERSGSGILVEVYPAAALTRWDFDPHGYKGKKGKEIRQRLVADFVQRTRGWIRIPETSLGDCLESDNAFDALICALIARANDVGLTEPVPLDLSARANTEGWIALPLMGSLDKLLTG